MQSPTLLPVIQAITGPTPRGGGVWRWILREYEESIFRRGLPVMTQALHFKDFQLSPRQLARWRQKPLRAWYNGELGLNYQAPVFVDSGGYLFLSGPPPVLRDFGLEDPLEIFRLGLDLVDAPGDRVTPLDYPLPPGFPAEEARARLEGTLQNALRALRFLADHPKGERVRLVLPVHGRTPEEAAQFAAHAVEQAREKGFLHLVWGLGLGSMVPLRKAHRTLEILAYVRAVKRTVPDMPLHVFGVTGLLVPFLLRAGAVSFDSSGYIQRARSLKYITPDYKERKLRELGGYPCDCAICRKRDYRQDLETLNAERNQVPRGAKSAVYGAVALHNLEMDLRLFREAVQRMEADALDEYLEELTRQHLRLKTLLSVLKERPFTQPVLLKVKFQAKPYPAPRNDPEAFDWRRTGWQPKHPVLLLLPCAAKKPYTEAQSIRPILRAIAGLPVDVVFLSGLYGPVPLEFVEHPAVLSYDFLLQRGDKEAFARLRERLFPLLNLYPENLRVAYLSPPAYRAVVRGLPVRLLPENNRGIYAGRKKENLKALTATLKALVEEEAQNLLPQGQQLPLL